MIPPLVPVVAALTPRYQQPHHLTRQELELGADGDSLAAMLRHNHHSTDLGASASRSRSNSLGLSTSGGGDAGGQRALLLEALEAWVLTSSLGDDATRREQHQRRWRRQMALRQQQQHQEGRQPQQQQQEDGVGPMAPSLLQQPHFFFHDDAAGTLRRQQSAPPPSSSSVAGGDDDHHPCSSPITRQGLGRLLESMLNLDKEVRWCWVALRRACIECTVLRVPYTRPLQSLYTTPTPTVGRAQPVRSGVAVGHGHGDTPCPGRPRAAAPASSAALVSIDPWRRGHPDDRGTYMRVDCLLGIKIETHSPLH